MTAEAGLTAEMDDEMSDGSEASTELMVTNNQWSIVTNNLSHDVVSHNDKMSVHKNMLGLDCKRGRFPAGTKRGA